AFEALVADLLEVGDAVAGDPLGRHQALRRREICSVDRLLEDVAPLLAREVEDRSKIAVELIERHEGDGLEFGQPLGALRAAGLLAGLDAVEFRLAVLA